jgi:hypothetical protein
MRAATRQSIGLYPIIQSAASAVSEELCALSSALTLDEADLLEARRNIKPFRSWTLLFLTNLRICSD